MLGDRLAEDGKAESGAGVSGVGGGGRNSEFRVRNSEWGDDGTGPQMGTNGHKFLGRGCWFVASRLGEGNRR